MRRQRPPFPVIASSPHPPIATPASGALPWVTTALVLANLLGFLVELRLGAELGAFIQRWGVVPVDVVESLRQRDPVVLVTLLTATFLHAGWLHLLFNLLYLAVFGGAVENRLGHGRYLALYLASGVVGGLTYSLEQPTISTPAIGASGATAGVIAAHLALFPGATLGSLAPVLFLHVVENVPALLLLVLWLFTQLFSGVASITASGAVAWWAHLGGFATGLVLAPTLRPERRR